MSEVTVSGWTEIPFDVHVDIKCGNCKHSLNAECKRDTEVLVRPCPKCGVEPYESESKDILEGFLEATKHSCRKEVQSLRRQAKVLLDRAGMPEVRSHESDEVRLAAWRQEGGE